MTQQPKQNFVLWLAGTLLFVGVVTAVWLGSYFFIHRNDPPQRVLTDAGERS